MSKGSQESTQTLFLKVQCLELNMQAFGSKQIGSYYWHKLRPFKDHVPTSLEKGIPEI